MKVHRLGDGSVALYRAEVVEAVLAAAPQAVVVHQDQGLDAARSVRSYGGGAATAHVVAELLGGGA